MQFVLFILFIRILSTLTPSSNLFIFIVKRVPCSALKLPLFFPIYTCYLNPKQMRISWQTFLG